MDSEQYKITTIPPEPDSEVPVVDHRRDDYEFGRELLYHAAEQMQEVLNTAVALAIEAQNPRAIEVAKDSVETLAGLASKIMKHQEQKQKINGEAARAPVTNNNLNVKMSSKDLLELLRKDE